MIRVPRFSIRTLLILVAVAGLIAAYVGSRVRARYVHQRLVKSLQADGCSVIEGEDSVFLVQGCTLSPRTLELMERDDLSFSTSGVTNNVLAHGIMRGLHQYRHSADPAEQAVQAAVDKLRESFPLELMLLENDRRGCRLGAMGGKLTVEGAELLSKASNIYVIWTNDDDSLAIQFEPGAEEILLRAFHKRQQPEGHSVSYERR